MKQTEIRQLRLYGFELPVRIFYLELHQAMQEQELQFSILEV